MYPVPALMPPSLVSADLSAAMFGSVAAGFSPEPSRLRLSGP